MGKAILILGLLDGAKTKAGKTIIINFANLLPAVDFIVWNGYNMCRKTAEPVCLTKNGEGIWLLCKNNYLIRSFIGMIWFKIDSDYL